MWTTFLTLLKNKYTLTALMVVCLIISGGITYHKIYNGGYQQGIIYQQSVYQKAKDKQDALDKESQIKADKERTALNSEIVSLKGKLSALQVLDKNKASNTAKQVTEYEKTNKNIGNICIPSNDDGMRILNESFPD